MTDDRGISILAHPDQWAHCRHEQTALLPGGGVQLTWAEASRAAEECTRGRPLPGQPGGLVFDPWCTAYRSWPDRGAVTATAADRPSTPGHPGAYDRPRGLVVDSARRLYIADSGARSVVVLDLEQRRVLRRLSLGPRRPVDVLAHCGRVLTLTTAGAGGAPAGLFWLEGRRGPRAGPPLVRPRCPGRLRPTRLAAGPLVLWTGRAGAVIARPDGTVELELEDATDLDVGPGGVLVVARRPGDSFRRFAPAEGGRTDGWLELEPVGAPGYDGGAIAHTPAGRIAFTTATGLGTTTGAAVIRAVEGSVISYRLDSGSYRTRWGRMFLDACLPTRTAITARFLTTDEDTVPDPIDPAPPARPLLVGRPFPVHGQPYPPLPSASALEAGGTAGAVFRRPTGREDSWSGGTEYDTFEAPVIAPPGRYLWVQLNLRGTDQATPQLRAVRIERPGHRLLNSLPRNWSRTEEDAGFLQRFLSPAEGMLHELDWRAAKRAVLLDPRATPADRLEWLASFAGLVLDRRWPERSRRQLIAEAYPLFARRGTKAALLRLLELYLGRPPTIVEQWQLRGLGGTVLDLQPTGPEAPWVGGSARAAGSLGRFTLGGRRPDSDSYLESAHRCTVLVPGRLTDEQRAVVLGLLEVHRPAHVVIGLCELGDGMRVGERLRVALTSFVGPAAGWQPLVIGEGGLGTDGVLGRAAGGTRVGEHRVGRVRVG
jgi:phage tail-like protein